MARSTLQSRSCRASSRSAATWPRCTSCCRRSRCRADANVEPHELLRLVERAVPGEGLSTDDLLGVCWDVDEGPSVVLGDDVGAVSVAVRNGLGAVQLLVVDPDARGEGRGRRLLDDATS